MSHRTRPTNSLTVRTSVAAAAFVAFGLLSAACSDSKSVTSADPTPTSVTDTTVEMPDTTTADTALATTTTAVVETTVAPVVTMPLAVASTLAPSALPPPPPPAPDCPSAVAPTADAISLVTTDGDWNGDGALDSAVSWAEPVGGGLDWFVRTEVAGGASSSVALGDLGVGFASVMDDVDVDFSLGLPEGSNRDEFLAVVGVSSSGYLVGVFGVGDDGCSFRFDDGVDAPFQMATTGTIGQLSGFRCDGAAGSQFLVQLEASSVDEVHWDTRDMRIRRDGTQSLVLDPAIENTLTADDPALAGYAQGNCGGFTYFNEFGDEGGGDY